MSQVERREYLDANDGCAWENMHHRTLINDESAVRMRYLRDGFRRLIGITADHGEPLEEEEAKGKIFESVGKLSRDEIASIGMRVNNGLNPSRDLSDFDLLQNICNKVKNPDEYTQELIFLRILLDLLVQDISYVDLEWEFLDPGIRGRIKGSEFYRKKTREALRKAWEFYCTEITGRTRLADDNAFPEDFDGGLGELRERISSYNGDQMAKPYLFLCGFYD